MIKPKFDELVDAAQAQLDADWERFNAERPRTPPKDDEERKQRGARYIEWQREHTKKALQLFELMEAEIDAKPKG